jgi:hypothetical protein
MGSVESRVATLRRACESPQCSCWRQGEVWVTVTYEPGMRTYSDLRNEVAHRMQLPPMRVGLYEQRGVWMDGSPIPLNTGAEEVIICCP